MRHCTALLYRVNDVESLLCSLQELTTSRITENAPFFLSIERYNEHTATWRDFHAQNASSCQNSQTIGVNDIFVLNTKRNEFDAHRAMYNLYCIRNMMVQWDCWNGVKFWNWPILSTKIASTHCIHYIECNRHSLRWFNYFTLKLSYWIGPKWANIAWMNDSLSGTSDWIVKHIDILWNVTCN